MKSDQNATLPSPEQWVELYGDRLFRFALARLRDPDLAAEVVQETLLAALRSASSFRSESKLRTWLIGILRHKIIDHFRRQSRLSEVPLEVDEADPEADLFDERGRWRVPPTDWGPDPHQNLESAEFQQVFRECLDKIPAPSRAALLLRTLEGLSADEVCKELGLTPTHLWVRIHRARAALRRCLDEHWFAGKNR